MRDVTPEDLKSILERSGSSIGGGGFLQIGGMSVVYSTGAAAGSKVVSVTLDDTTPIVVGGVVVPGAPNVAIVTNNFTADGGDDYTTFASIPPSRKINLGLTYEQALVEYLLSFPEVGGLPTVPAATSVTPTPTARVGSRSTPDDPASMIER